MYISMYIVNIYENYISYNIYEKEKGYYIAFIKRKAKN